MEKLLNIIGKYQKNGFGGMGRFTVAVLVTLTLFVISIAPSYAFTFNFQDDSFHEIPSEGVVFNSDDGGDEDVTLQFGSDALDGFLIWDDGADKLIFDSDSTDQVLQFGNDATDGVITWNNASDIFSYSDAIEVSAVGDAEFFRLNDTTNADFTSIFTGTGSPDTSLSAQTGSLFLDQSGSAYLNTSTGSGTDWSQLAFTGSPYAQTVTVAKSGGDYTSVKSALDSITDSSSSKRYVVLVYPGTYTEDPMTIPSYVSIEGVGNSENVIIIASTPASILITAGLNSVVRDVQLEGATGSSCYQTSTISSIENIQLKNCATGVYITGASGNLAANTIVVDEGTFTDVVKVDGGALAHITALLIRDGTITTGASVTGNNSTLYVEDSWILATSITNGIYVDDTVTANVPRVTIRNATYGIHVGPTGASATQGPGGLIGDSDTYDLYVESSTAKVFLAGWRMNEDKLNFDSSATVVLSFNDDTTDNESFTVLGELHIGTPEYPRESVFGEGDSYINGMMVYTYNTSTYTDVSTAAKSGTGSTFTFPGVAVDNAIYISSDRKDSSGNYVKFPGYKMKMGGTGVTLGTGEIVHEYWNGSAWTEFNIMCSSGTLFYPYDDDCFLRPSTSEQMRFDSAINDNWAVNDPPTTGTSRYWSRIRIKTAITTAPVFEQFKVHSNRMEINPDGTESYFGTARHRETFVVSPDTVFFGRGTNAPDNRSFTVGTGGVSWSDERFRSAFSGASLLEEITGSITLPKGIDTSSGLIARIYWVKINGNTGNTEWNIDYVVKGAKNVNVANGTSVTPAGRSAGDDITGTAGSTIQTAATGTSDGAYETILSEFTTTLDISGYYEGDILYLRLYRDPLDADDTYGSDVIMTGFEMNGVFWTAGEKL